jgi:chromosome segregation ATPase
MDITTVATALGLGALLSKLADRALARPDREREHDKSMRDELRAEMSTMRERIAVLEMRVQDITRERDEHRANVLVREAERDAARARVVHLEEVVAELREENSHLVVELAQVRRQFGELDEAHGHGHGEG